MIGASVVGAAVVGATVVGATVVGATVVGATVVGATVVGAAVVGTTVVGATVVGATVVVGTTVVGPIAVGASVVGATVVGVGSFVVSTVKSSIFPNLNVEEPVFVTVYVPVKVLVPFAGISVYTCRSFSFERSSFIPIEHAFDAVTSTVTLYVCPFVTLSV